ncbi:conserved hypothetical protein [uncultured Defluviicoccus sp.]|uniref:Membrane-associated oxidoreductase n=1 Tax=metagenome TaxID=256318 RepID=A0A380TBF7_9ZZZZ|nr:conserved hypothetical protein [uncultured Defluviicoccus sp.]
MATQSTAAALKPSPAEQRVIAAAAAGAVCDFRVNNPAADDPARAETWGTERALRADVLRALCLGLRPDWPLDPRGVQVRGARIDGALDLAAATVAVPLLFWDCAFTDAPIVRDATLKILSLVGSRLPGLVGDGLTVQSSLLLRGTRLSGEVRFLGAKIGGDLSCIKGSFENPRGQALSAESLTTGGNVFLRDGFRAAGEVRLLGAKIGGDLACSDGSFDNPGGVALSADGADVRGGLFWRQLQAPPAGRVSLAHATVGVLADDLQSWPGPGALNLSGFVYGAIAASSMTDAARRLDWLRRQDPQLFSPQPYEQLAKVLRQMGHDDDARKIAIARKQALIARSGNRASRLARHLVLWPVGYGYRPGRALWSLLALIAFGTLIFSGPVGSGVMLPAKLGEAQVTAYRACAALPPGYPRFQPLVYAIDTALPIIDFHQEAWWLPDEADVRGFWTQVYLWLHIALGWLLTTLGIAAVTGIIKRD